MSKKIVILNGGARLNGNTVELINEFTRGAESKGHTVIRFDLDKMNIHWILCHSIQAAIHLVFTIKLFSFRCSET